MKRTVACDGGPSPAGRLLTIYLQKTFQRSKRSQRRGVPGLFVKWAGMKREEEKQRCSCLLLTSRQMQTAAPVSFAAHSFTANESTAPSSVLGFAVVGSSGWRCCATTAGPGEIPGEAWVGLARDFAIPGQTNLSLNMQQHSLFAPHRKKSSRSSDIKKKKKMLILWRELDQASSCDHVGGRIRCSFHPLLPSGRILQRFGSTLAPMFAD